MASGLNQENSTLNIAFALDYYAHHTFKENLSVFSDITDEANIFIASNQGLNSLSALDINTLIEGPRLFEKTQLSALLSKLSTPYLALILRPAGLKLEEEVFNKMLSKLQKEGTALVCSSFTNYLTREQITPCSYQPGSVRDDFDFGPLVVLDVAKVRAIMQTTELPDDYTAWYALRLALLSRYGASLIEEPLYGVHELSEDCFDTRHFSYVDVANLEQQKAFEATFTSFAKKEGFYLRPRSKTIEDFKGDFPVELSVVIPVKNREHTISDALSSALAQDTRFSYNVIVVDNHSEDNTTKLIAELAKDDKRIIHLIPETQHLGIGGCWNLAIANPACGRFVLQLDSDDLYIDKNVLKQVYDAFFSFKTGVIVGAYKLVDRELNDIPPGLIDHREWSDINGHNNLLRINGMGAPRAFYTPLLREHPFLNVSYGEDYGVMLKLSRLYKIGRIYEPLYLCRRWEGNTEAAASQDLMRRHNMFKDKLRSEEVIARKNLTP